MGALSLNVQELVSSWWHYVVSLNRARERECAEFKDSCLIAADIAVRASAKIRWAGASCSRLRPRQFQIDRSQPARTSASSQS